MKFMLILLAGAAIVAYGIAVGNVAMVLVGGAVAVTSVAFRR